MTKMKMRFAFDVDAALGSEVDKVIDLLTADPIVMASVKWQFRAGGNEGVLMDSYNNTVGWWAITDK